MTYAAIIKRLSKITGELEYLQHAASRLDKARLAEHIGDAKKECIEALRS